MSDKSSKKIGYISLLSVLSAIAVVFTHTNECFWTFSTESYWISATVIECLMSFCVPVFFMVSGATLIDYRDRYDTKTFFKKRIFRTLIPYITWCYIGMIYNLCTGAMSIEEVTPLKLLTTVIACESVPIFWFFPVLFGIYLCIPLFAAVEKNLRKSVFTYLVVASFIVNSLIPFIRMIFNLDFVWPLSVQVASSYLLYVLVGYLLSHYEISIKWEIFIYVCGLVGLLTQIIVTYFTSIEAGDIITLYKGFESIECIVYSVAVFLLFKRIGLATMKGGFEKVITFLGSYTLGIYLTHYFVMGELRKVCELYLNIPYTSFIYRLGAPFIIIPICVLFIWIVRKIPILRYIVP